MTKKCDRTKIRVLIASTNRGITLSIQRVLKKKKTRNYRSTCTRLYYSVNQRCSKRECKKVVGGNCIEKKKR